MPIASSARALGVYRIVAAYRAGRLGFGLEADGRLGPPIRATVLLPWLRRALLALLKRSPHAFGWCRTRWSCALLAAELKARRGVEVSAETVRRWVHEVGSRLETGQARRPRR